MNIFPRLRDRATSVSGAALAVALAGVAAAGGACSPRREAIAIEPPGTRPFSFPYVDSAVPGAPAVFNGPAGTAAGAPNIAYPLDGAMHPLNLGAVTFQWTRGDAASQVFRIRLDDGASQYDFYVPCCAYTLPAAGWLAVASAHRDGQLTATIAGTDGLGGPVYQSNAITVRFSPEPVLGGLYYWTAADIGGTTYRLPFGAATATPFIVPKSPTDPLPCGGCHSVSRDGAMISFAATPDQGSSAATLSVAATHTPEQASISPIGAMAPKARFTALDSDGSRVLITTFGEVQVFETATGKAVDIGAVAGLLPSGKLVTHPEWSPGGHRVAFTLYSGMLPDGSGGMRSVADTRPEDGEIATLELDPQTGKATALRRIVVTSAADGLAHYYPTWSPDEHWLVIVGVPNGTSAYNASKARLRLASADADLQTCPGPTCFDLARASQGTDVSSTWPKLSPNAQSDGRILFVTFSSKMDYGTYLKNTGASGAQRAQLWMAAIDLGLARAGADPSLAPIWLPFQNFTQTNHLAFWTTVVTCTSTGSPFDSCGSDQICDNGVCRPLPP